MMEIDLFGPARVKFCEPTLVNELIKHPADTWTNIGPIVAGIYILLKSDQKLLGWCAIWMGISSAIFHATNTVLGEMLDLNGMFAFILTLIAYRKHWSGGFVLVGSFFLAGLSLVNGWFGIPAFAALVIYFLYRTYKDKAFNKNLTYAFITLMVAWGFWWLDFLHIMCDPNNHILTGHGVWHLLNGLVVYFVYEHLIQLEVEGSILPVGGWDKPHDRLLFK